ncbi:putative reverse transcriptase domain-containing protein [Tanacetum coccineum]
MPPEDKVLPAEEQPLFAIVSHTADSPGYVPESDPGEDPEEDDDEDPEEDPADYPVDGGDDGDNEDESSDEDEDDEDVDIKGDKEEEEHPALVGSIAVALPAVDHAPHAEEIAVARLLAIPTPPPSPFSPWSSPLPQIPSPPLPFDTSHSPLLYHLHHLLVYLSLGFSSCDESVESCGPIYFPFISSTTTRLYSSHHIRCTISGTPPLLPIPLPTSSHLCIYSLLTVEQTNPRLPYYSERWRDVGYGIIDTWDEMLVDMSGAPATDDIELGRRMTEFATRVRQDTYEIYVRLDDEQTERQLMVGRLNMLYRDRRAHARTALLMEKEARMSREAWGKSMDASDLARSEVMSLRTTVLGLQAMITELQAADRRRQATITKWLVANHRRQAQFIEALKLLKALQTQMTAFQRQQGPSKGPAQPDAPGEAGVTTALAARDANRSTNGDDSHVSRIGVRRTERVARETVGHDVAYAMTWTDLKKKITDKYYPRVEIKKLEAELWNLKVKGTDVIGYNQCFQELALLCVRMFPEESNKIERYVGGLPDMIHRSVVASKPKTMQEAIEIATKLMDKKIRTFAERQTKNKRKQDDNHQQPQQRQENKRQNTGRAYTAISREKKPYGGSKPLCAKCNYHHNGPCAPKCHKCNRVGHLARDCRSTANANTANNQRGTRTAGNGNAPAKVYVVGRAGTNPESNIVTGTFLLNNRYASVLFDTGADRSFVSAAFSSQIDIIPTALDYYYDVELANGRVIRLNTILSGSTLNFLNHLFNIDLMPIELGSFDAIIGMDWLAKYQAIIMCAKKTIRIPWGNETLIVHGDGSNQGNETRLNIISCTKTQKYMLKGCPIVLAHVTTKEIEDKSEKKLLEDVPIIRNFPKVFPEDLSGLPPTRQVEF